MVEQNAILFCQVDKEDGWVGGGIVFRVSKCGAHVDAYNELKEQLEYPDFIAYVVEEYCLLNDLFDNDETYKFKQTCWEGKLVFEFENSEGNIVELKLSSHSVYVSGEEDTFVHVSADAPSDDMIEELVGSALRKKYHDDDTVHDSQDDIKKQYPEQFRICFETLKKICERRFEGNYWMMPNRACPCTYLEEPCRPNCSCKFPYSSAGCSCCVLCGSKEQRTEHAKYIISKIRKPDEPEKMTRVQFDNILRFSSLFCGIEILEKSPDYIIEKFNRFIGNETVVNNEPKTGGIHRVIENGIIEKYYERWGSLIDSMVV